MPMENTTIIELEMIELNSTLHFLGCPLSMYIYIYTPVYASGSWMHAVCAVRTERENYYSTEAASMS